MKQKYPLTHRSFLERFFLNSTRGKVFNFMRGVASLSDMSGGISHISLKRKNRYDDMAAIGQYFKTTGTYIRNAQNALIHQKTEKGL
jgi:hypothetical protein